jgi:hypothetical protein
MKTTKIEKVRAKYDGTVRAAKLKPSAGRPDGNFPYQDVRSLTERLSSQDQDTGVWHPGELYIEIKRISQLDEDGLEAEELSTEERDRAVAFVHEADTYKVGPEDAPKEEQAGLMHRFETAVTICQDCGATTRKALGDLQHHHFCDACKGKHGVGAKGKKAQPVLTPEARKARAKAFLNMGV